MRSRMLVVLPAFTAILLGAAPHLRAADAPFSVVKVSKLFEDWEVTVNSGWTVVGSVTFKEVFATKDPDSPTTLSGTPFTLKGSSWFYGMNVIDTAGVVNLELSFRKAKKDYPVTDILKITKVAGQKPKFELLMPKNAKASDKGVKCTLDESMYLTVPEFKGSWKGISVANPFLAIGLE